MKDYVESIVVGLGQMQVIKERPVVLTCLGLGSSIALCAYDPVANVGGMAHMVLPSSGEGTNRAPSPKYVDTGVPMLIEEMVRQGALKSGLLVKIAGGARVLRIEGLDESLDVGGRNIEAAKVALAKEGISIAAADVGGIYGRTVHLFADSGKVIVKPVGGLGIQL